MSVLQHRIKHRYIALPRNDLAICSYFLLLPVIHILEQTRARLVSHKTCHHTPCKYTQISLYLYPINDAIYFFGRSSREGVQRWDLSLFYQRILLGLPKNDGISQLRVLHCISDRHRLLVRLYNCGQILCGFLVTYMLDKKCLRSQCTVRGE
jgi:hypothetical protein